MEVLCFLPSTHYPLYDSDLRATHARTLLPAALASVSFGFVLVRVRVWVHCPYQLPATYTTVVTFCYGNFEVLLARKTGYSSRRQSHAPSCRRARTFVFVWCCCLLVRSALERIGLIVEFVIWIKLLSIHEKSMTGASSFLQQHYSYFLYIWSNLKCIEEMNNHIFHVSFCKLIKYIGNQIVIDSKTWNKCKLAFFITAWRMNSVIKLSFSLK